MKSNLWLRTLRATEGSRASHVPSSFPKIPGAVPFVSIVFSPRTAVLEYFSLALYCPASFMIDTVHLWPLPTGPRNLPELTHCADGRQRKAHVQEKLMMCHSFRLLIHLKGKQGRVRGPFPYRQYTVGTSVHLPLHAMDRIAPKWYSVRVSSARDAPA